MISREEKTEVYINICTMFGTKPTKETINSIPKKNLVDVCYRLYEIIEEKEKRIDKAIEYLESYNTDFKNCRFGEAPISMRELGDLMEILKGEDNE